MAKYVTLLIFAVITVVTVFVYLNLPVPVKLLVVKTGSMEPTIKVGSLVLVTKQSTDIFYSSGEIITFQKGKELVSHRVVYAINKNGQRYYQTKGDANQNPDTDLVAANNVVGGVNLVIPYIGRFTEFVKTPLGFILLLVIPTLLIIVSESIAIFEELQKKKTSQKLDFAKPIVMLLVAALFIGNTHAFFSDVATSTNNIFSTAPIFPGAPGSVVINEINWEGSNGDGNDEWVELRNTTGSPINLTNWVIDNLGTGNGPGANIKITACLVSCTIPANGFFLLSAETKANSKINVDPDILNSSISLNNGGEQLVLRNSSLVVIDTANGTGAWFFGSNSTPKKSMERKTPPGDGTISTNWQTATTHTNMDASGSTDEFGTPKAPNGL